MTAQELLQSHETVRQHFETWFAGQKMTSSVEQCIARLSPAFWKGFCLSPQGKMCYDAGINLSQYTAPTLATGKATASKPAPAKPAPLIVPGCVRCGVALASTHTHTMCQACMDAADQAQLPVQPSITPQPVISTPVQTSTPANPLIAALIAELQSAGFTPQQSVSAQQCQSIAEEAALSVVDMVVEQLKRDGIGAKQIIEIREPGTVRQITGKAPVWFPRLRKLAACGVPALLVGPAGSGKTTAFELLAESLDLPFHRVSIAAGTDEGQLQGWLHPIGDHMQFDYVYSVVSRAYEEGGCVLIDDIDLGDPNALGILNAVLDNGPWHVPLRHNNPSFVRSERFYIGGAANTFGHGADKRFVGANQLDERTLSRFRMGQIMCDYDPELERELFADDVVSYGHMLRARCRALPSFQRDVSTRDMSSVQKLRAQFSLNEAWYGYFADWSKDELNRIHARVDHADMIASLD